MRFGPGLAEAHRRARGIDPRGPSTPTPEPSAHVRLEFDDPLSSLDAIVFLLGPACERLLDELRNREQAVAVAHLFLEEEHTDARASIEVRAGAPIDDARSLLELFRTKLERTTLRAPVVALELRATEQVPHARRTLPMPHGPPESRDGAREVALERLRARLGPDAVRQASRVERGHLGDRAQWLVRLDSPSVTTEPAPGEALPWRRVDPPAQVVRGAATVAGQRRRILRLSRVERAQRAWWGDTPRSGGEADVELLAWAELEGPLLALVRARFGADRDQWEVIAWLD
jgi:hypothetical protein